jgi:pimeloyl-ACP methyl ester carboxylesterase
MDKLFTCNTGKIHYRDQGKGPVIMLIHGYLETSEIWGSFAKRLLENFRIITVDLPGHGKSENAEEVLTMDYMAAILAKLLEFLNIRKVFLTGHSLGGYVTLAFADLHFDLLSGYCLLHSHPFADDSGKIEKRKIEAGIVEKGRKDWFIPGNIAKLYATANLKKFSESIKRSIEIALKVPDGTIIAVLKGMMIRPSRVSVMESGKVPYLWILGAMDNLINCGEIQSGVHVPKNAEVIILEKSGHMGFIEEEDLVLSVLESFVSKLKKS